jgi:hypothetical protein
MPQGGGMHVWCTHDATGLAATDSSVQGLEASGLDGQFIPAKVPNESDSVVASTSMGSSRVAVRYG